MNAISASSRWIAAARAIESARADALFQDPYAAALAGDADPHRQAYNPYLSIRTRFFDDALFAAVLAGRLTQVVLLGAGMDTRAFRFDWNPDLKWFEIDQDEVLEPKQAILDSHGSLPRCKRITVPIDLKHDWTTALMQAGFDRNRPAAFLVEGVLIYLKPRAAKSLLKSLSAIAAPGSWLGTDIASADFLKESSRRSLLARLRKDGCAWRFGVNDAPSFVERFGWRASYSRPGEPEANFGRWTEPVPPRGAPGVKQRSFLITAMK
jgi:methyltransferase (TIGR00027 family)